MPSGSTYRAWAALTVFLVSAPASFAQNIPVFIFAGQSNAVGFATDYSELTLSQQATQNKVLYSGQQYDPVNWAAISGPTQFNDPDPGFDPGAHPVYSGQGFGPEFSAPLTISNALGGTTVGAVKYAVNATGLRQDNSTDDWAPTSGELYSQMNSRVSTAISQLSIQQPGKSGTVSGFFWMQGERDASDEDRADLYQNNLVNFINSVRSQYGSNLPIVIGRVMNEPVHGDWIDTIRRAQVNVSKLMTGVTFVDTDDLQRGSPSIPFGTVHFSTQGTYDLGVRMGHAYIAMQNPAPAGPASMNLALNGSFEDYAVSRFAGFPGNHPDSGEPYPSNPIPAWTTATAGGHTLVNSASGFGANQGQQFLSLENRFFGSGDGGAQQAIATTSGTLYTVFFDYTTIAHGDDETVTFTADFGGAGTQSISIDTTGFGEGSMTPWTTRMFSVTFGSSTTRDLRFQDTSSLDQLFFGPAIDNVKIIQGAIWTDSGGGDDLDDNANWNSTAPSGAGALANFMGLGTNFNVDVHSDTTLGSLRFDSATGYTLATGNNRTLTMDVASGNATALVAQGSHTISLPVTLADSLDVDAAASSTLTVSGQITPSGAGRALRKFGDGNLVLSNSNNTYNGNTSVVGGTLRLVNAGATNNISASPNVILYSGATLDTTGLSGGGISLAGGQNLQGSGTIRGGLNATNAGGHAITPGNSVGILTFAGSGNITLDSDATITMEVGGAGSSTGEAGWSYDQIVIDGSGKTFNVGGARLGFVALSGISLNHAYTLVSAVNGASINFSTVFRNLGNTANLSEGPVHNQSGIQFTLHYESSFIAVTFLTPEPSSLGTALLGSIALLRRRRR